MKLKGFRYDNCLKEAGSSFLSPDSAPADWFSVEKRTFIFSPSWTFCSTSCLYQWSTNRLDEEARKAREEVSE